MLKSSRSNVSHFECCVQAWACHFIPYKVRLELVLEVAYMAQESSGILIILNALQVFFYFDVGDFVKISSITLRFSTALGWLPHPIPLGPLHSEETEKLVDKVYSGS